MDAAMGLNHVAPVWIEQKKGLEAVIAEAGWTDDIHGRIHLESVFKNAIWGSKVGIAHMGIQSSDVNANLSATQTVVWELQAKKRVWIRNIHVSVIPSFFFFLRISYGSSNEQY